LAQEKNVSVVRPGRRGKPAASFSQPLTAVDLFAGSRVMTHPEATIEQGVVIVPVDERRCVVGAEKRLMPDDVLITGFALLERNVTARAGFDGVHRAKGTTGIAGADIDETQLRERRRDRQL